MRETRVRSLCWEDPLEKEMATHSSTLAWKIPWTEEPGRLQSMGSQTVGHNWVTNTYLLWFSSEQFEKGKRLCRTFFFFFFLIAKAMAMGWKGCQSSTHRSITSGALAVRGFPPCGFRNCPWTLDLESCFSGPPKKKRKEKKEISEFPTIHFCFCFSFF